MVIYNQQLLCWPLGRTLWNWWWSVHKSRVKPSASSGWPVLCMMSHWRTNERAIRVIDPWGHLRGSQPHHVSLQARNTAHLPNRLPARYPNSCPHKCPNPGEPWVSQDSLYPLSASQGLWAPSDLETLFGISHPGSLHLEAAIPPFPYSARFVLNTQLFKTQQYLVRYPYLSG